MKTRSMIRTAIAVAGILAFQYLATAEDADQWLKDATKWSFSNGQEINGGAKGSFTVEDVDGKKAGKLEFDFTGGGGYVTASIPFESAGNFTSLKFSVKAEAKTALLIRLKDNSNETFQYKLQYTTPGKWQEITIDPKAAKEKFGGDKNGTFDPPSKKLAIGVSKGKEAGKGVLYFSSIQVVK